MTIHDCDRAFARIDCGLLHYRHVTPHEESPERAANLLPSVLMHASPSSSRSLQSLALALANSARGEVIAASDARTRGLRERHGAAAR
jgi:hypothetical protein